MGRNKEHENVKKSLGKRLRIIRCTREYSQEDMANKLEMSTAYYGKIERGINVLSVEKILLLYKLFNIDLHFFLTGELSKSNNLEDILNKSESRNKDEARNIIENTLKWLANDM